MPTRETQNLILDTAIRLFNEHGVKFVSTNRVADECGVSRGNLHYHFRTKEEVIQSIYRRIEKEIAESWYDDHLHSSMQYMRFIFARQIDLIWRYRFFYRELNVLLHNDPELKCMFMDNREKRIKELGLFFENVIDAGLMVEPGPPVTLDSLLQVTWLVTDQWVPYLDIHDEVVDEKSIEQGFELILEILMPYFTPAGLEEYRKLTGRRVSGGEP